MRRTVLAYLAGTSLVLAPPVRTATRPHYGGTLRVEMHARVASLDPREWPSNPSEAAAKERFDVLLFDHLVRLDENARPQPALAVSWEHDAQSKRWQFHLRPGVKFHDGSPMTPAAVATALQSLGAPWGGLTNGERSVGISGDSLVIESQNLMPNLPAELARGRNFIFHATPDGGVTGTGPFRVTEWPGGDSPQSGSVPARAVFTANEDCWAGRPFLDAIEVHMGVAPPQQVIDLELGKADVVEVAPDQTRRAAQSGARTWFSAPTALLALVVDARRPGVQDVRIRQALALSIDRTAIWNVLLQKQGEIAGGLLPQWLSGYAFLFPTASEPERAKELRADAGATPPLILVYDADDAIARAVAERIAVNAREAGITVQVTPSGARIAAADVRLVRAHIISTEPRTALADLAALLELHAALPPGAAASPEQLYAAERALVDSYEVVPLVHLPETFGLSAQVKNWMPGRWGAWRLDDVWLSTASQAAAVGNKP